MRTDFDVAMLFRVWSAGSGGCVVGGLMVGAGLAGRSLEFCGFAVWQVVMDACWLALAWTGLVLCSRSLVWSVIRVLRADGLTVVDCLCACGLLEFSGFVVSQRLMVGCRPVLERTGFDFVV